LIFISLENTVNIYLFY